MVVTSRIAGKPLATVNKIDMERIIADINKALLADTSKHDYKVAIRKYYQWLRGCNEEETETTE